MKKKTIILSVFAYLISMFSFELLMSLKNHSMNKTMMQVVTTSILFLIAMFSITIVMNRERLKELLIISTSTCLMMSFTATFNKFANTTKSDDGNTLVLQPIIDRDRTKQRVFVWEFTEEA